jgi:hypothetical protein
MVTGLLDTSSSTRRLMLLTKHRPLFKVYGEGTAIGSQKLLLTPDFFFVRHVHALFLIDEATPWRSAIGKDNKS